MNRCFTSLAIGLMSSSAAAAPAYAEGTKVVIPFARPDPTFDQGAALSVAIDGGAARAPAIDTGSTGYAVSASSLPNYAELLKTPGVVPGYSFLSSSKLLWRGHWVPVKVSLLDHGREVATAQVPILAVEEVAYCPGYKGGNVCKGATFTAPAKPIDYLGIGFARERDHQPQGTPDKNVLLNIATINGAPVSTLQRGYIIEPEGITIGFTDADVASFAQVALSPDPANDDKKGGVVLEQEWNPTPAQIFVDGKPAPAVGTVLFDMGVPQMYLTVPGMTYKTTTAQDPSVKTKTLNVFAVGERVALTFGKASLSPAYAFTVSAVPATEATGVEPLVVIPSTAGAFFANTGRHFFRQYRYVYNNTKGYVGFQPIAP